MRLLLRNSMLLNLKNNWTMNNREESRKPQRKGATQTTHGVHCSMWSPQRPVRGGLYLFDHSFVFLLPHSRKPNCGNDHDVSMLDVFESLWLPSLVYKASKITIPLIYLGLTKSEFVNVLKTTKT